MLPPAQLHRLARASVDRPIDDGIRRWFTDAETRLWAFCDGSIAEVNS